MKRIKILFFTSSLGGGGAEMHLLRLVNALAREAFEIEVALARGGGNYEKLLANDIKKHILAPSQTKSSTVSMFQSILPLRQLLQDSKPDILCSFLDHANLVATVACTGFKNIKLVVSVQNTLSEKYKTSRSLFKRLYLLLLNNTYLNANHIVTCSRGIAEDMQLLFPSLNTPITTIYNAGFDENVIKASKENVENLPPILIVACGRLTEQKGFRYLIEALPLIRKEVAAHLWIIGEGENRQKLEEQIESLQLNNVVTLLGYQKNPYKFMAAASLFVLSSLYEGFGNVIVEAMACATPVIATDCPNGPAEIIDDNFNGKLVASANPQALAQAIIHLLQDSEKRKCLAEKGHLRANDFAAPTIANHYTTLFSQV